MSGSNAFVYFVVQQYHPARVLTIAYQPFALGTTAIMTYHEAKMNTRLRNLVGFSLFAISSVVVLVVSSLSNNFTHYLLSSLQHFVQQC